MQNPIVLTSCQEFSREVWCHIRSDVLAGINWVLRERALQFSGSWTLSSKTISEIGGRLVEDWLISNLEVGLSSVRETGKLHCNSFRVVPVAGRSIGDIAIKFSLDNHVYTLLIDVKAANLIARDETHRFYKTHKIAKNKPGESHPNLISIPRAEQWYKNPDNISSDLAVFHCLYRPVCEKKQITFDFTETIRNDLSLFLLRDNSSRNLTTGSLGRGQLQLTKVSKIQFTERTRDEFLTFLKDFVAEKATKKARSYL